MSLASSLRFFLTVSVLGGCISPLSFEPEFEPNVLVVDGFITNGNGPHVIWISKIAKYGKVVGGGTILPEEGADVTLIGDNSHTIGLYEETLGRYIIPEFYSGVPGASYKLRIETADGEVFESSPELLKTGPEIDTLLTRFVTLPSSDNFEFRSGVEILSQWQDPPNERNYHLWTRHRGTYKIITLPQNPVPSCCAICWVTDISDKITVHEDSKQNGNLTTEVAAFLEDDGRKFRFKYHLQLNQYTVSPEAYEYYRLLQSQLEISGSIFDPPVAEIKGNFRSLGDTDRKVIGFFGAFGVQTKTLFFDRDIIEKRQPEPIIYDHCQFLPNSTPEKPPFWED